MEGEGGKGEGEMEGEERGCEKWRGREERKKRGREGEERRTFVNFLLSRTKLHVHCACAFMTSPNITHVDTSS